MRAVVCTRYGAPDVLEVQEVERPVPEDDEVLVRVRATTVSSGDCRLREWNMPTGFSLAGRLAFGIRRPRNPILGGDVAGEVEAVGGDVTRFEEGDQVFGSTGLRLGAHAEYVCLSEDAALATLPKGVDFEVAAAVPFGGLTALTYLRDLGSIEQGHRVLVNGASGAVGTAAVQVARHYGAEVTGVCSTRNIELVTSLGASRVIDYTQEDLASHGGTYEIIFDTVGTTSFSQCKGMLTPQGRYLVALAGLPEFARMLWTSVTGGRKLKAGMASERTEDLLVLRDLVERGELSPVIDRRYPLEETAEAHRYVDQGHKRGNVVIIVAEDPA